MLNTNIKRHGQKKKKRQEIVFKLNRDINFMQTKNDIAVGWQQCTCWWIVSRQNELRWHGPDIYSLAFIFIFFFKVLGWQTKLLCICILSSYTEQKKAHWTAWSTGFIQSSGDNESATFQRQKASWHTKESAACWRKTYVSYWVLLLCRQYTKQHHSFATIASCQHVTPPKEG